MSSVAPRPHTVLLARGEARDLDQVMAIMAVAFPAEFGEAWTRSQCAGILPMSGVVLTIARNQVDREPHGFSLMRTTVDEAELLLIAVAPDVRRRGAGRALLDRFVRDAQAQGAVRFHLEVRDGNPATGLYHDAGFEIVGRRRNYYRGNGGTQFDALTLARGAPLS